MRNPNIANWLLSAELANSPRLRRHPGTDEGSIEQVDRVLALRTDRNPRRILVHERIVDVARAGPASILYFGPSMRDAECMAYLLK